jgi:hypothetical protein
MSLRILSFQAFVGRLVAEIPTNSWHPCLEIVSQLRSWERELYGLTDPGPAGKPFAP